MAQTASSVSFVGTEIGPNQPVYIIGEIGLNHNGEMEIAKKLIDVAFETGCNAVKFQRRTVENLATNDVLDAKDDRFPEFGSTYREIREKMEFSEGEFREILDYAEKKGILCFCTPFDVDAVDYLETFNLKAYKVASHSVTNLSMLHRLAEVGKPVVMSTGMCSLEELDQAVKILLDKKVPLVLLHCVSAYPTPKGEENLSVINVLSERYGVPVGYSGHEIGYFPTVVAVSMGACTVERHITLDNSMMGFDHKLSVAPKELQEMNDHIRWIEAMRGEGNKQVSEKEQITRDKYHVSIVSAFDINEGTVLEEQMFTFKNPGTGLAPSMMAEIIGKKAKTFIPADTLVSQDQFG